MLEREPKKMQKKNELKRNPKEKWVEMKMKEKQGRKTKVELVPHAMKNDPWSNYQKTQFGPIYPFFRNPNPSLHYVL